MSQYKVSSGRNVDLISKLRELVNFHHHLLSLSKRMCTDHHLLTDFPVFKSANNNKLSNDFIILLLRNILTECEGQQHKTDNAVQTPLTKSVDTVAGRSYY